MGDRVPARAAASRRGTSSGAPLVVPVVVPHGLCGDWCPLCPRAADGDDTLALMPGAEDVRRAMLRYAPRRTAAETVLLAIYGGTLPALPHAVRAPLLDACEREVRSGRADGIRVVADADRLLHAPLGEWLARGVRSVEVPLLSTDGGVLRDWSATSHAARARRAVERLRLLEIEVGLCLFPGLPGDSHERAVRTALDVAAMRPDYVRILPALALEGTRLEDAWRRGRWEPMSLEQAVETTSAMLEILRDAGVEIARVGLQPEFDLVRGPAVLEGPYHPSLRHLAESRYFRRVILDIARRRAFEDELVLRVHPRDDSYARGPHNGTVAELRRRFRFQGVRIVHDPDLPRGRPRPGNDP